MQNNLGPLNQAVRAGVGLFVLATPLLELPTFPYNLIGVVLIATGVSAFCPLQALGSALFAAKPRHQTSHSSSHA